MLAPRFFPLVFKYVIRHRARSLLTIVGVAAAMFLFYSVQAMQQGVREATRESANDTTLVVYREDRYCPFTSNLPQNYTARIASIPGVKTVVPMNVMVNNCRTSLDVVTFRGVPAEAFDGGRLDHMTVIEGSVENWKSRSDAALVGERLANRRGLKSGDRLDIGGATISVAGVVRSPRPQDQNAAYTHLDFVQRAAGKVGIVTQFHVEVEDPSLLDNVADAIDQEFRTSQEPTSTWSEKAFVARAAADIVELVNFSLWLGWGSLIGVFALIANAVFLSVRDRIRDHAVMETLGYGPGLIARLVILEGLILSMTGGLIGLSTGVILAHIKDVSLSVEGLSVNVSAGVGTLLLGLAVAVAMGVLASLVPALQAYRTKPAASFRAV
jgi:putative ABC transport system permease protein